MADVKAMQVKEDVEAATTPIVTEAVATDSDNLIFVNEDIVIKVENETDADAAATVVETEMDVDVQPEPTLGIDNDSKVKVENSGDSNGNGEVNGSNERQIDEAESQMESNDNNTTEDCACGEDILIAENKRLSGALFQLHERQSLLEDFIEVEYGKQFEVFMKNRDRLVKMGFGSKDSSSTMETSGVKTFKKSKELVDLLKMIKDQNNSGTSNSNSVRQNSSRNTASIASAPGSRSAPYKVPGPVTPAKAPVDEKTDPAVLKEYRELKVKLVCPECKQIIQSKEIRAHLRGHCTSNSEVECAMCDKSLAICEEKIISHFTNYHHLSKDRSTSIASQMIKEWDAKHKAKIDALISKTRHPTKLEFDEFKKQNDSKEKSEVEVKVKNGNAPTPNSVVEAK